MISACCPFGTLKPSVCWKWSLLAIIVLRWATNAGSAGHNQQITQVRLILLISAISGLLNASSQRIVTRRIVHLQLNALVSILITCPNLDRNSFNQAIISGIFLYRMDRVLFRKPFS